MAAFANRPEWTGQRPGNFEQYWGYGNQQNYEAHGAPKSNRPQQQQGQKPPDMSVYKPQADNPYAFRQPYSGPQDSGYAYDNQSGQWQTPQQSDKTVQDKADVIRQMYGSPPAPMPPGEWRPMSRSPWAPSQFYPEGSDKPDLSYGERPSNRPRPGQAQPIQPQDTGTPYGQSFSLPGYAESGAYGGPMTYGGPSQMGNLSHAPMDQRPQPFTAKYTNFDGSVSDQPNFGQRDAFIQQINDNMMPYYAGQSQGRPQFNFQNMWKNAGKMVDNGWTNPFAPPPTQIPTLEAYLAQYAPQAMYQ